MEGFVGRSSLLYHQLPPTQTHKVELVREVELIAVGEDQPHRHHLTKTDQIPAHGDAVTGRAYAVRPP